MRIAVIADTHNRLPASVRSAISSADEIWHLGDICTRELLREVRGIGPPVEVIAGNCDPQDIAPESLVLQRGGHSFLLVHIPLRTAPIGVDHVLHGHTHVPRDETIAAVRHLNPGSVGKPNHGAAASFAWLEVDQDGSVRWTLAPCAQTRVEPIGVSNHTSSR